MRSSAGKTDKAVDSRMKLLHLLYWSSLCFGALHEAVHFDHEQRR